MVTQAESLQVQAGAVQGGGEPARIAFLDGLRGVAIMMVAAYHAFSRYPDLMPYGSRYAGFIAFRYGLMGVQLFFLISGFVILMTLRRCPSATVFARRRWLRLFPAMALAALVEVALWQLLPLTPGGAPTLLKAVPGLTFIDGSWWSWLLNRQVPPLSGTYWSLFVEVRFYAVAALIYFVTGSSRLVISVLVAWTGGYLAAGPLGIGAARGTVFIDAGAAVWFAAGALFYRWFETRSERVFLAALAVGALAAFSVFPALGPRAVGAALVVLFALSLRIAVIQRLLALPPMLFLGGVSYPFYLIHENMLIAVTRALGGLPVPGLLLPLPGLALALVTAYLIARYAEPWLRGVVDRLTRLRPRAVGLDRHGQPLV